MRPKLGMTATALLRPRRMRPTRMAASTSAATRAVTKLPPATKAASRADATTTPRGRLVRVGLQMRRTHPRSASAAAL